MKPKIIPPAKPKVNRIYEVVIENNASQFREKVQALMDRQFEPTGGITMTAVAGVLWVGQAFIRVGSFRDL
jgi:hypothetical protein